MEAEVLSDRVQPQHWTRETDLRIRKRSVEYDAIEFTTISYWVIFPKTHNKQLTQ